MKSLVGYPSGWRLARSLGCLCGTLLLALGASGDAATSPPVGFSHILPMTDTGGLETRSAALILSGQEGGELPLAVIATAYGETTQGETAHGEAVQHPAGVDLWCTLGGEDVSSSWPEEAEDLLVEIYAYALDDRGGVAQYLSKALRLSRQQHAAMLAAGDPLHIAGRMPLKAGEYSLRVLVLLRQSGRLSMRVKTLVVPSSSGPDDSAATSSSLAATSSPLAMFLRPADGLLALAEPGGSRMPGVFHLNGVDWIPQEWPDLNSNEKLFFLSEDIPPTVQVVVQDQNGSELRRLTATPRAVPATVALAEVILEPTGLPPGQYLLSLTTQEDTPQQRIGVRVRPEVVEGAGQAQAAIEQRSAAAAMAMDRPDAGGTSSAKSSERRQQDAAYRAALDLLASGNSAGAVEAVMRLEQAAMSGGTPKEEGKLTIVEMSVANLMAIKKAETLVPILVLHEELYRRYRRQNLFLLATHSRKLVARLIDLYQQRSETPEAKQVSAEIFTSQAGFLLELGSALAARNALSAALENDGDLPVALYLQATMSEALGDYPRAVDDLRRLADLDALDAAGRLRLAINLKRLGKKNAEAESILRHLVAREANDWVTVVAIQELAASLWASGERQEAVTFLRGALERFPTASRLTIQTASFLDRLGRPGEARKLLRSLETAEAGEGETPRLRYSQWPLEDITTVRRSLRQRQRQHLPALQKMLDVGRQGSRAPR